MRPATRVDFEKYLAGEQDYAVIDEGLLSLSQGFKDFCATLIGSTHLTVIEECARICVKPGLIWTKTSILTLISFDGSFERVLEFSACLDWSHESTNVSLQNECRELAEFIFGTKAENIFQPAKVIIFTDMSKGKAYIFPKIGHFDEDPMPEDDIPF